MSRTWSLLLTVGVATTSLLAQGVTDSPRLLARRYVEGNRFRYRMTGNENRTTFQANIVAMTTKRTDGRFVEEIAWSDMVVKGAPRALADEPGVSTRSDSRRIRPITGTRYGRQRQVSPPRSILSATLENAVTKITRDCSDIALTQCGEPRSDPTLRHIEISLLTD